MVCPCRNEEGNIAGAVERLPEMGSGTELIFVEGGSTDGTRAEIERQIAAHPEKSVSLVVQTGKGEGDAVKPGCAAAQNDVLMILDGDLSVAPDDCRSSTASSSTDPPSWSTARASSTTWRRARCAF